ncbi:DUF4079 domain-containing protein [Fortiea contorta]|uniref:DUF4079 domain-containing protein n=1 Tax=Fortiea contorta TaxID=1892405 RepID=UPI00034556B2|nr:DUF4079 domain-containing protein [Fortiea contorta]
MVDVNAVLEPIASWFHFLGLPHVIVHWGHPVMMAIAIFVLGSFVGVAGWRGKLLENQDKDAAVKSRIAHRQLAPWLFVSLAGGYIGGVLAIVMHHQPIFKSPHFYTGSLVLLLLVINVIIALSGFFGNKKVLRATHAYLGTVALLILFYHAALGLKLGLSF